MVVCSKKIRVNRCFLKMRIVYGPREAPRERKRGASASTSSAKAAEGPAAKKAKKTEAVGPQITKEATERPP